VTNDASLPSLAWIAAVTTPFGLVFPAELGDKSQLVCMTLAARHRHRPVLVGAMVAFAILNTLGVVAGRKLLRRIPIHRLHQVSGVFFLTLAAFALTRVF